MSLPMRTTLSRVQIGTTLNELVYISDYTPIAASHIYIDSHKITLVGNAFKDPRLFLAYITRTPEACITKDHKA